MSRQQSLRTSGRATKGPSLTHDLLMLGDIYLTLAWMGFQRMRYGSPRAQEAGRGAVEAPAAATLRRRDAGEEDVNSVTRHRG